jgi:CRISPR type I-E-associated protein CasB/Cse2
VDSGWHRPRAEAIVKDWQDIGRRVRKAYDSKTFGPGPRAELRRLKTPAEVMTDGHFLTLLSRCGLRLEHTCALAPVMWLFPTAEHRTNDRFQLGRYLRQEIYAEVADGELATRARRFRQLVAAEDANERVHHLRRLLVHAYQRNRRPVDWGAITRDLAGFGDATRRRWAESFFFRSLSSPAQETAHVQSNAK